MSSLVFLTTSATARMSVIFKVGFVGDSSQTTFVFGLMAAAIVFYNIIIFIQFINRKLNDFKSFNKINSFFQRLNIDLFHPVERHTSLEQ